MLLGSVTFLHVQDHHTGENYRLLLGFDNRLTFPSQTRSQFCTVVGE